LKTLKEWNNLKTDAVPKNKTIVVGYLNVSNIKPTETNTPKNEEKPKETTTVKSEKKSEPEITQEKIIPVPEKKIDSVVVEPIDETGFFKKKFNPQNDAVIIINRTLVSGIFKTDAGKNDKKYYMLMDGVAPGTIVKISNPKNEKYVYAKVLGSMSEVKYSEGFDMRISEAAAKVLETVDSERFEVKVNY
jgi:hypothetical protein